MQRRVRPQLERLETRDAPATLVSATKLTYQDVDGDDVTVTLSKPILNAGNVSTIFGFDTGGVGGSNAIKQQLHFLTVKNVPGAAGVNITTSASASKVNGGDGFAALGYVEASEALGLVTIDGDLAVIVSGSGINGLTVQSMGRYGLSTGAATLTSSISGNLNSLSVKGDLQNANIIVWKPNTGIGSVNIGGSLIGGAAGVTGSISASGNIGKVTIKGDIVGGAGIRSGSILTFVGNIGSVTIGGSIRGGGMDSGIIAAASALGPVKVTGDVVGGSGLGSGIISGAKSVAGVTIGGSLRGGAGESSGRIVSGDGSVGPVAIAGSIVGAGEESGQVNAKTTLGNVTITGSVRGGDGTNSGHVVAAGDVGKITVGGDVSGKGAGSAQILSTGGKIAAVTIGGSLRGNGDMAGQINAAGALGPVKIVGELAGAGIDAGAVVSGATIASVAIGGGIVAGGDSKHSGRVTAQGDIGAVTIGGGVLGGSEESGSIRSIAGKIAGVTIAGSLLAGGKNAGSITAAGDLGPVKIGGDVFAHDGDAAASIASGGKIASVTIGGSLLSLTEAVGAGRIAANGDIGAVTVVGNVFGTGAQSGSIVSLGGKIAGVTVGGSMFAFSHIYAKGDLGPVKIAGDVTGMGDDGGSIVSDGTVKSVLIGGSLSGAPVLGFDTKGLRRSRVFGKAALGSVTVNGSVVGGPSANSGEIGSDGPVGSVTILGSLVGDPTAAADNGRIFAGGTLGAVTIGHDLIGGGGQNSGEILGSASAGKIRIGGDLVGGASQYAGAVKIQNLLASLTIGGSVIGGAGVTSGIIDLGDAPSIAITGDLVGGSAGGDVSLVASGSIVVEHRLSKLTIGGSLVAGTDATNGIFAFNGAIIVGNLVDATIGNIAGNATSPAVIFARGQTSPPKSGDLAIGKLNVLGRVEYAQIRAGFDHDLNNADNLDAQIGSVTVGGDWIASSIAAGAAPGDDNFFGNADDLKPTGNGFQNDPNVSSRINSLTIAGQALGTPGDGDHYGIVAEFVGAVKIGGTPLVLHLGNSNDNLLVAVTNDFTVREI